jgi:hypothetical protein
MFVAMSMNGKARFALRSRKQSAPDTLSPVTLN